MKESAKYNRYRGPKARASSATSGAKRRRRLVVQPLESRQLLAADGLEFTTQLVLQTPDNVSAVIMQVDRSSSRHIATVSLRDGRDQQINPNRGQSDDEIEIVTGGSGPIRVAPAERVPATPAVSNGGGGAGQPAGGGQVPIIDLGAEAAIPTTPTPGPAIPPLLPGQATNVAADAPANAATAPTTPATAQAGAVGTSNNALPSADVSATVSAAVTPLGENTGTKISRFGNSTSTVGIDVLATASVDRSATTDSVGGLDSEFGYQSDHSGRGTVSIRPDSSIHLNAFEPHNGIGIRLVELADRGGQAADAKRIAVSAEAIDRWITQDQQLQFGVGMFNAFAPTPVATSWAEETSEPVAAEAWLPSRAQLVQASLVGIGCYTVVKFRCRPRHTEIDLPRRKRDLHHQ